MSRSALFSVPASNQFVAYLVLHDARVSSNELRVAQGEDWRRSWISTVTFLRCIGHVLDKVDGKSNNKAREVINEWWKKLKESKPKPEIFWGFIESERNTALKAYSSSVRVEIKPASDENSRIKFSANGPALSMIPGPGSIAKFLYTEAPFEDCDPVELVDAALAWWTIQLNIIEKQIASR
jgi:hypothetical protein